MTELDAVISFLTHISDFEVAGDIAHFKRIRAYYRRKPDDVDFIRGYLTALLSYSKAIVAGLNSRRLVFESRYLRRTQHMAYPRLFGGVLSTVFHDDGHLKSRYSTRAIEVVLQCLAFFKRVQIAECKKSADIQAVETFLAYQHQERPFSKDTTSDIRKIHNYVMKDFDKAAELGWPGPGATLDEMHPYCPSHSYLNTFDPSLPDSIRDHYDLAFGRHTGFKDSRSWYFSSADTLVPGLYSAKKGLTLRSVCVPKNTTVSRLITINSVGNTIIGATARNTIKMLWKRLGIDHQMNVDDQTKSHKTLLTHFSEVSALDLEGGSSCLTLALLREILPDCLHDYLDYMEGARFKLPEDYEYLLGWDYFCQDSSVPVTTLLMGDSIATAVLTTTMWSCCFLAYIYYRLMRKLGVDTVDQLRRLGTIPINFTHIRRYLPEFKELPVQIVGDDIIVPYFLDSILRAILSDIGVTVNEDKSSTKDSIHKESCGCWVIKGYDGELVRIYPFRLPEFGTLGSTLANISQFLDKAANSRVLPELVLTFMDITQKGYKYLSGESYRPDHIGSALGCGLPYVATTKSQKMKTKSLHDTTAYTFNIKNRSLDQLNFESTSPLGEIIRDNDIYRREIIVRNGRFTNARRTLVREFKDPAQPTASHVSGRRAYQMVRSANGDVTTVAGKYEKSTSVKVTS